MDESLSEEGFGRLLGKHKWCEFLKEPQDAEKTNESLVFLWTSQKIVTVV